MGHNPDFYLRTHMHVQINAQPIGNQGNDTYDSLMNHVCCLNVTNVPNLLNFPSSTARYCASVVRGNDELGNPCRACVNEVNEGA